MVTFLHPECQLNLMQGLPPESNRSSESASLQEEKLAAVSTDTFGVLTQITHEYITHSPTGCVFCQGPPCLSYPFNLLTCRVFVLNKLSSLFQDNSSDITNTNC